MAEDPVFSSFTNSGAASSFARVISKIKNDMAAIERSAKNIQASMEKAARATAGMGAGFGAQNSGGKTGFSSGTMDSSLGEISGGGGGGGLPPGTGRVAAVGMAGLFTGAGGGLGLGGFTDLRVGPQRALDFEAARFGTAQATGQFSSFQNILDSAQTDFNVQNEAAFMDSVVSATQRGGMVGLMGGGTVGERKAGQIIGGYNSLAGMAGVDQSQVGGAMSSMYGASAYYSSLAAGVQTRNPVTGELASSEQIINQIWTNTGLDKMSPEAALMQIDIDYGYGGMGRAQLNEMFGGNQATVDMVVEGLRLRAQSGGGALETGQMESAAKEAGLLGTENTQGMEGQRNLESSKLKQTGEYTNDVTAGVEEATKHLANAVDYLTQLEGPLRDIVGAMETFAAQMDVFNTEMPKTTGAFTDFFGSLAGSFLGGRMGGGGGFGIPGLGKGGFSFGKGASGMKGMFKEGGMFAKGSAGRSGLKMLGKGGGILGGALALLDVGSETVGALKGDYADEQVDKGDFWWTVAKRTGQGTLSGTMIAPGMGSLIGGGVGLVAGLIEATVKELKDNDQSKVNHAEGEWFVASDTDARIHQGEMVLPNRVATAVRAELGVGETSGTISNRSKPKNGNGTTVNIYLTIQRASDQEAIQFAHKVKGIIEADHELAQIGAGRFA